MSAFMQGLQTGSQVAQGWMDTYENARKRRQAEMLEQQRQGILTAQPEEFQQFTEQQGADLRRLGEEGNVDIGYDQERGAYTVTPRGLAPEARTPSMTSVVAPQSRRRFLGQEYSPEDLTPERTQRLREQAMVDTIADPIERQRGLQSLRQAEAADLQLSEAKSAAQLRENTQKALAFVAEQTAAGEILDVPALSKIAADTGADAQELIRGVASALNLTTAQAEAKTKKLVSDINKAATSPEAFNKLLVSFDPNPEDNILPELRVGEDGSYQVFYGDQAMSPAFKDTKDMSGMARIASHYSDQVSGNPTATAVQLLTLEVKRAQIAASEAGAFKDRQVGLAAGLEKPGKDITPQQQRAFDVLKGTDAFKTAVERSDQPKIRDLLVKNGLPPELFLGATAAPPGGGTMDEGPEPASAKPDSAAPTPTPTRTEPSPAALRGLRERAIGRFTSNEVVEAAAAAGNPQAIEEERRRVQERERVGRATESQMRGLGGLGG